MRDDLYPDWRTEDYERRYRHEPDEALYMAEAFGIGPRRQDEYPPPPAEVLELNLRRKCSGCGAEVATDGTCPLCGTELAA